MAIRNLYPNLPGHLVEFKDGGLQVSTNDNNLNGYNKSLLILGTAYDGPINEPVKIDQTTVSQVFGDEVNSKGFPNGATLTKYAKQAFKNGFSDVRCMRVTGKQAFADIVKSVDQNIEVVDGEPISLTIPGTTENVSFALNCLPITDTPNGVRMKLTQTLGTVDTAISATVVYGDYDGTISIPQGILSKHPKVKAEYSYKEISDANGVINTVAAGQNMKQTLSDYHTITTLSPLTINKVKNNPITDLRESGSASSFTATGTTNVDVLDSGGNIIVYELNVDPNNATASSYLYVTPYTSGTPQDDCGKLPITRENTPVEVYLIDTTSSTETLLTYGTDYTVSGNQLTLSGSSYTANHQIRVEYYTYQLKKAIDSFTSLNVATDTNDSIVISPRPVGDTVVVKDVNGNIIDSAGTAYNSGYTVTPNATTDELTVMFPAGNYEADFVLKVEYKTNNITTNTESFTVVAKYGGQLYNGAKMTIAEETVNGVVGRRFTFTKPTAKLYGTSDKPFYFTSFDCATVGELKVALGRYNLNNVFDVITSNEDMTLNDIPVGVAVLGGGEDGVNPTNNAMYEALSGIRDKDGYLVQRGAYQILENYHCDYIYVAGIYADSVQTVNKYSSFHHELALLCAVLTYRTKMTHGFIDVKPNVNTTLVGIQKYVDKLISLDNLHYMMDADGNELVDSANAKMDIGWYTSLVVGPDPIMVSDKLGTYYGSAAIAYAALCASINPQSAPTNKALPGVKGMKYRFSNKQMDALVGNRMVCFQLKNEGVTGASTVPYCVDGMTCGAPNCDYSRMATVKVVTDVVDQVREVADPFIGEPNTVEQRNALSALISKRLSRLMETGEIQHYEFQINATIEQVLLGECTIALTLVPAMELRKITTVVSLRAAA